MKIAIISIKTGKKRSGLWHYSNDLVRAVSDGRARGHSFYFIAEDGCIDDYALPGGCTRIPVKSHANPLLKWLRLTCGIFRIIAAERIKVAHFTSEDVPVIFLGLAKRLFLLPRDLRLVCTLHDLGEFVVFSDRYSFLKVLFRHLSVPAILYFSDMIIVPSQSTLNDLSRIFGKAFSAKTRVIYNAVHSVGLGEPRACGMGCLAGKRYFLCVAELHHPSKNHVRLIRAFRRFAVSSGEEYLLFLAGPKGRNWQRIIAEIRACRCEELVHYLGYVPQEALSALYRNASALLQVSLYEGFGRPVIEAMRFRIPVLASNRGSLPEIAGDSAMYVDPENEEEIVSGLKSVARGNRGKGIPVRSAASLAEDFSPERVADKVVESYETVYAHSQDLRTGYRQSFQR